MVLSVCLVNSWKRIARKSKRQSPVRPVLQVPHIHPLPPLPLHPLLHQHGPPYIHPPSMSRALAVTTKRRARSRHPPRDSKVLPLGRYLAHPEKRSVVLPVVSPPVTRRNSDPQRLGNPFCGKSKNHPVHPYTSQDSNWLLLWLQRKKGYVHHSMSNNTNVNSRPVHPHIPPYPIHCHRVLHLTIDKPHPPPPHFLSLCPPLPPPSLPLPHHRF